jgi:uncharacterized FlaG/YvyC family protein
MEIINKSRKIISINGEPFLPGKTMALPDGMEGNPSIADYIAKGIISYAGDEAQTAPDDTVGDAERARIAEEAVAKYKAEQEALAAVQAELEAEINDVKAMKKKDLLKKAAGMGIEVKDDDTEETIREKILAALGQQ